MSLLWSILSGIRLRLTTLFASLFVLSGLIASIYLNRLLTEQMLQSQGESIHQLAFGIARAISVNLTERDREIRLLAATLSQRAALSEVAESRRSLNALQQSYPSYAWVGIADIQGTVRVATGQLLEGQSVTKRPWFIHGQQAPFIGDVHEAVLLSKLLPQSKSQAKGEPLRFVDFTAQVYDLNGKLHGVLAAHVLWEWAEQTVSGTLSGKHRRAQIDVLILDKNNHVISPYAAVGEQKLPVQLNAGQDFIVANWPGAGDYLYTVVGLDGSLAQQLGWRVIVRQPLEQALVSVRLVRNSLLSFELLATLILIVTVYQFARRISQPIEQLAQNALEITCDHNRGWHELANTTRELQQLSIAFGHMIATLLQKKDELVQLNAGLEQTVAQRTAELSLANKELAERAELQEQLARRDALTGVANRMAANERLQFEQQRFQRTQQLYAILMLDIDYFKRINDNFGHDVGDQVLIKTADILQHQLRRTDFIARFGGEEFLVILPETGIEGAMQLAEKLRNAIAEYPFAVVNSVTLSIGVAVVNFSDQFSDSLLKRADQALYRSKHQGRNQVSVGMPSA